MMLQGHASVEELCHQRVNVCTQAIVFLFEPTHFVCMLSLLLKKSTRQRGVLGIKLHQPQPELSLATLKTLHGKSSKRGLGQVQEWGGAIVGINPQQDNAPLPFKLKKDESAGASRSLTCR
jgi:hypothetical protein